MKLNREVMYMAGMITQLGISMLAPVVLCVFAGYWLDNRFGWHTVIPLLILGILAGVRNCYLLIRHIQNRERKKEDDRKN